MHKSPFVMLEGLKAHDGRTLAFECIAVAEHFDPQREDQPCTPNFSREQAEVLYYFRPDLRSRSILCGDDTLTIIGEPFHRIDIGDLSPGGYLLHDADDDADFAVARVIMTKEQSATVNVSAKTTATIIDRYKQKAGLGSQDIDVDDVRYMLEAAIEAGVIRLVNATGKTASTQARGSASPSLRGSSISGALKAIEERDKAVKRLLAVPMISEEHRFRCLASFLPIDKLNEIAEQWKSST